MSDPDLASRCVCNDKSNAPTLQPCPAWVSDPESHKQKSSLHALSLQLNSAQSHQRLNVS